MVISLNTENHCLQFLKVEKQKWKWTNAFVVQNCSIHRLVIQLCYLGLLLRPCDRRRCHGHCCKKWQREIRRSLQLKPPVSLDLKFTVCWNGTCGSLYCIEMLPESVMFSPFVHNYAVVSVYVVLFIWYYCQTQEMSQPGAVPIV